MRKIKFRIWDKINRMWFKRFNVNLLNIGDLQNVEMMQYTGIKDKNDNEIYEGDIVKDVSDGIAGYIEYSDGGYEIIYDNIAEKLNADEASCVEIMGNIFENPELLGED